MTTQNPPQVGRPAPVSPGGRTTTTEDFIRACEVVLASPKTNGYAKAYADTGQQLAQLSEATCRGMFYRKGLEEVLVTQALYLLSNLTAWRGPDAAQVRSMLKQFVAERQTGLSRRRA